MEANPYYLRDSEGNYYNQYPEFQIWEAGRQAGIQEAVEWLNSLVVGEKLLSGEPGQAKLKEWEASAPLCIGGKMEAKDTVMNNKQIGMEVSGFPFETCPSEWKRALLKQAEISFQAGIKEAEINHNYWDGTWEL